MARYDEKKYTWDPNQHALGVEELDKDHQLLFRVVNKLHMIMDENEDRRKWACRESLKFFEDHALDHFAREEDYMRAINYDGYEMHKRIHDNFRERLLPTIKKELEQTDYSIQAIDHFVGVAGGWLVGHTLTEDQAIVGRSTSKVRKVRDISQEQFLVAMRRVTRDIGEDMFYFGSELLTDDYGGEAFGRGVYYEQVFDTGNGRDKQIVIMVFEEKLLLGTLGEAMGVRSHKLDTVLVHATRHTARQFVRRVLEQFPDMANYQLESDSMLTYEQFQKVFMDREMRASLLYDTGYGYLGIVMPEAGRLRSHPAGSDPHSAPLDEVQQYIRKMEEIESRPKVLVVDDSALVRRSMLESLENDYDVAIAASGPNALRAIALNRPELMILSYEMRGWDGPKTLEKLAEYETLSGVPVVFSIDRNDKASLRQVKALTPYGYVLKKMSAEALKAKVAETLEAIANGAEGEGMEEPQSEVS